MYSAGTKLFLCFCVSVSIFFWGGVKRGEEGKSSVRSGNGEKAAICPQISMKKEPCKPRSHSARAREVNAV